MIPTKQFGHFLEEFTATAEYKVSRLIPMYPGIVLQTFVTIQL
jgi:hypothetical protein